ncbi:25178_t:CDS:2, partial [Dentiscutata erythropus]
EKEKMDYDPLVDSGNKDKQFNIEFLVIPIHEFFGFPTNYLRYEEFKNVSFNIRVSDPKAKTYKDIKLQDKVSDYFDKKPVTGSTLILNIHLPLLRRREKRRQNRTPPPTYEEVLSMLNISHRESPAGQRDRSASLAQRIPTKRDETTNRDNINNVNDADGNSGHNTNDVGRNLDNATYSSLSNL